MIESLLDKTRQFPGDAAANYALQEKRQFVFSIFLVQKMVKQSHLRQLASEGLVAGAAQERMGGKYILTENTKSQVKTKAADFRPTGQE